MKVCIVTGASRGIGRASALALAARGAALLVTARDVGRLEALVEEAGCPPDRIAAVGADISDPQAAKRIVEAAVDRFGRLDAVVNNAGVLEPLGLLVDNDPDAWRESLVVNVVGPALLMRAALPALAESRGAVVNVSSGAAVKALRGWSAYCTSKAALNHLNRVVATETPAVTCIAFSPGMTDTDMQQLIRSDGPGRMPEPELSRFVEAHRSGQLRPVDEVGRAIAALAVDAPASWSGEYISIEEPRFAEWMRGQ